MKKLIICFVTMCFFISCPGIVLIPEVIAGVRDYRQKHFRQLRQLRQHPKRMKRPRRIRPVRIVKAEMPFNFSTTPAYRKDVEPYQKPAPILRFLSETNVVETDIAIEEEVKALALQLEYNPILIADWVRNNIEHTPSYGSKAGAAYTLKIKSGNSFDQATLLIALLRASDVEAKYAVGKAELSSNKLVNWIGGETGRVAANIMLRNKVPIGILQDSDQKVTLARFDHVWVRVFNMFGLGRWTLFSPSYKPYTYTEKSDLKATTYEDTEHMAELIAAGDLSGMEAILHELATEMAIESEGMTLNEVIGARKIRQTTIVNPQLILHSAVRGNYNLAYDMNRNGVVNSEDALMLLQSGKTFYSIRPYANLEEYETLPTHLRTRIKFVLPGAEYEVLASEIVGKRISINFTDEDVYSISNPSDFVVAPSLKIDGETMVTGSNMTLGKVSSLTIKALRPGNGGQWDTTTKKIIAGSRCSVIVALQKIPLEIAKKASTHLNAELPELNEVETMDKTLHVTGLFFYGLQDNHEKTVSKSMNIHSSCCVSIGFVTREISPMISSITGKVVEIRKGGIVLDIPLHTVAPISFVGNDEDSITWMKTMGLVGSSLEHATIEFLFEGTQAVSTVKGFYEAVRQGIPIITLDNIDTMEEQLANIEASENVKSNIRNYMNMGFIAYIPKDQITLNLWKGQTWIVYDPETGSAGYQIDGGLNGGKATSPITDTIFDVATTVAVKSIKTTDALMVGGSMLVAAEVKVIGGILVLASAEAAGTAVTVSAGLFAVGGFVLGAVILAGAIVVTKQLLENAWHDGKLLIIRKHYYVQGFQSSQIC